MSVFALVDKVNLEIVSSTNYHAPSPLDGSGC